MASRVGDQPVTLSFKVKIKGKYHSFQCSTTDTIQKLVNQIKGHLNEGYTHLQLYANAGSKWCCTIVEEITDLESNVDTLRYVNYISLRILTDAHRASRSDPPRDMF